MRRRHAAARHTARGRTPRSEREEDGRSVSKEPNMRRQDLSLKKHLLSLWVLKTRRTLENEYNISARIMNEWATRTS